MDLKIKILKTYFSYLLMNWNKIQDDFKIKHIQNILSLTDYRSEELNIILDKLTFTDNTPTETNNTETFSNSEIIPKDVSSLFKKPWNKLPTVHQIIKIKEFCNKICSTKNSQISMEKKLITSLKNRQLKNDSVKYDETNGRIISINNLTQICKSANL
jgi:hypothetical protein